MKDSKADLWAWNNIWLVHMRVWTFKTSCCCNPDYITCTRALLGCYWHEWQSPKPLGLTRLCKRHEGRCLFNSLYKLCDTASHSSWTGIKHAQPTTIRQQKRKQKCKREVINASFLPTPLPFKSNCHTVFLEKEEVMLASNIFTAFWWKIKVLM